MAKRPADVQSSSLFPEPAASAPKPPRRNLQSEFDLFWQAYPVKSGKGYARTCFFRLVKVLPPIDALLAALEAQKRSARWRGGTIPNPSTWLNQERWEDDPSSLTAVGQGRERSRGAAASGGIPESQQYKPRRPWGAPDPDEDVS